MDDRKFLRYFSINHLITGGVTPAELDLQRDALAKALNHLSLKEELVRPEAIDEPVNSVLAVDIRRLGWHEQPFDRIQRGKPAAARLSTSSTWSCLNTPMASSTRTRKPLITSWRSS